MRLRCLPRRSLWLTLACLALGGAAPPASAEPPPWNLAAIQHQAALARLRELVKAPEDRRVVVAVLDTGVTARGLEGRLALRADGGPDGQSFLSGPSEPPLRGAGAILPEPNPAAPADAPASRYHGASVAGIIAQVNPDCEILPVRVMPQGDGGSEADVLDGIRWAIGRPLPGFAPPRRPAQVLNLSLAVRGISPVLRQGLAEALAAGVVVIVAAGNHGQYAAAYSPGALEDAITVGAATRYPLCPRAPYSNFGARVTLLAPGGLRPGDSIPCGGPDLGSVAEGLGTLPLLPDGGPTIQTGTSFAAPHVAAAAAMVKALLPGVQQRALAALLRESANFEYRCDLTTEGGCGAGLLDLDRLLQLAAVQRGCPCDGAHLCADLGRCVDPGPVAPPPPGSVSAGCGIAAPRSAGPWGDSAGIAGLLLVAMALAAWYRCVSRTCTLRGCQHRKASSPS